MWLLLFKIIGDGIGVNRTLLPPQVTVLSFVILSHTPPRKHANDKHVRYEEC